MLMTMFRSGLVGFLFTLTVTSRLVTVTKTSEKPQSRDEFLEQDANFALVSLSNTPTSDFTGDTVSFGEDASDVPFTTVIVERTNSEIDEVTTEDRTGETTEHGTAGNSQTSADVTTPCVWVCADELTTDRDMTLILGLSLGLGVPLLLATAGFIYTFVQMRKLKKSSSRNSNYLDIKMKRESIDENPSNTNNYSDNPVDHGRIDSTMSDFDLNDSFGEEPSYTNSAQVLQMSATGTEYQDDGFQGNVAQSYPNPAYQQSPSNYDMVPPARPVPKNSGSQGSIPQYDQVPTRPTNERRAGQELVIPPYNSPGNGGASEPIYENKTHQRRQQGESQIYQNYHSG